LNINDVGGAGAVADLVRSVIGRIWPDPAAQADASYKLAALVLSGDLARMTNESGLLLAQTAVNKAEAESEGWFKGGWRPFVGWVCGSALAWNFVARPAVLTVAAIYGHVVPLPPADMTELMPVLLGMLGLGVMRTVEKLKDKQ